MWSRLLQSRLVWPGGPLRRGGRIVHGFAGEWKGVRHMARLDRQEPVLDLAGTHPRRPTMPLPRTLAALLLACVCVLPAACASGGEWVELAGTRYAVEIAATDQERAYEIGRAHV